MDLSLNINTEIRFTIHDLLTINWGTFNIIDLGVDKNELNVSYDD